MLLHTEIELGISAALLVYSQVGLASYALLHEVGLPSTSGKGEAKQAFCLLQKDAESLYRAVDALLIRTLAICQEKSRPEMLQSMVDGGGLWS